MGVGLLDFFADYYLIIKSLHLISMVAWMAGLFYLPRLFVYHIDTQPLSQTSEVFKVMEMRLARIIMLPASILTLIFGLMLTFAPGVVGMSMGWFHAKITLVLLLFAYHGFLIRCMKSFSEDLRPYNRSFFVLINEVPTILLIGIVFMVVLKPF